MTSLKYCFKLLINPLYEFAIRKIRSSTTDGRALPLHLMAVSYVVDIPESVKIFSAKIGNRTAVPCHKCEAKCFFRNIQ